MNEVIKVMLTIAGTLSGLTVFYMVGQRSGYEQAKEEFERWIEQLKGKDTSNE